MINYIVACEGPELGTPSCLSLYADYFQLKAILASGPKENPLFNYVEEFELRDYQR